MYVPDRGDALEWRACSPTRRSGWLTPRPGREGSCGAAQASGLGVQKRAVCNSAELPRHTGVTYLSPLGVIRTPSPLPPPSPGVSGSLKVKRAPQFLKCSDFCIEVSLRYGWTHPQGDCYKQNTDQDDDDSAQGHTTNVFMKPRATGWIGLLTQTLPSSHWAGLRRLSLPTFKGSIYTNWSRNGAPPALCTVTAWPANCIWPLELE